MIYCWIDCYKIGCDIPLPSIIVLLFFSKDHNYPIVTLYLKDLLSANMQYLERGRYKCEIQTVYHLALSPLSLYYLLKCQELVQSHEPWPHMGPAYCSCGVPTYYSRGTHVGPTYYSGGTHVGPTYYSGGTHVGPMYYSGGAHDSIKLVSLS